MHAIYTAAIYGNTMTVTYMHAIYTADIYGNTMTVTYMHVIYTAAINGSTMSVITCYRYNVQYCQLHHVRCKLHFYLCCALTSVTSHDYCNYGLYFEHIIKYMTFIYVTDIVLPLIAAVYKFYHMLSLMY
jgi:hypothetical protein